MTWWFADQVLQPTVIFSLSELFICLRNEHSCCWGNSLGDVTANSRKHCTRNSLIDALLSNKWQIEFQWLWLFLHIKTVIASKSWWAFSRQKLSRTFLDALGNLFLNVVDVSWVSFYNLLLCTTVQEPVASSDIWKLSNIFYLCLVF